MKNFPAGMKIVVVTNLHEVIESVIARSGRGRIRYKFGYRFRKTAHVTFGWGPKRLLRSDEGTLWARGWEGPAADALRAEAALLRTTMPGTYYYTDEA